MYSLLIVDDEQMERKGLELLIQRSGRPFTCSQAVNGQEAVEKVSKAKTQVVLLDIQMPVLSGIDAAKKIRELSPDTLIIFLTAWGSFDFATEALRLGAKDYLVKPTTQETINTLLDNVIRMLNEQKKPNEELKNMLSSFTREFFTSLKYGTLSDEALRNYLELQGITREKGNTIIISKVNEHQLIKFFGEDPLLSSLSLCYYPSSDRISLLLFTDRIEEALSHFKKILEKHRIGYYCGVGRPFTQLSEIPQSIHSASLARLKAESQKSPCWICHCDGDVFDTRMTKQNIVSRTAEMQEFVLQGMTENARQKAHEILDIIHDGYGFGKIADQLAYESFFVFTYNIKAAIPYFLHADPEKESMMEMEVYIMDFIDDACRAVMQDNKDKYERSFAMIDRYLHLHYAQQININLLADMVKINPSYFSKLFKEYFTVPFVEYLTNIRLEKAKTLLLGGEAVTKTAELTGFSDHNYFSRVFRQKYNISPKKFKSGGTQ